MPPPLRALNPSAFFKIFADKFCKALGGGRRLGAAQGAHGDGTRGELFGAFQLADDAAVQTGQRHFAGDAGYAKTDACERNEQIVAGGFHFWLQLQAALEKLRLQKPP